VLGKSAPRKKAARRRHRRVRELIARKGTDTGPRAPGYNRARSFEWPSLPGRALVRSKSWAPSAPVFSPDGRWIAFNSNRTGRTEGYVARFHGEQSPPAIGHPLRITSDGGGVFDWRRDGKELLIGSGEDQVMSVPVDVRGEQISAGEGVPLFRMPANHGAVAVAPDGKRVLIVEYPYAAGQTIHVLTNWHQRIK
jgi:hypothetical protein